MDRDSSNFCHDFRDFNLCFKLFKAPQRTLSNAEVHIKSCYHMYRSLSHWGVNP